MYEHEFKKTLENYVEAGIIEKRIRTEKYVVDKDAFIYTFPEIKIECIIEPLCMTNRLDELRLITGTKTSVLNNNKTAKTDFNKLLSYYTVKYGEPYEHTIEKSGHEYVEWRNPANFNFEIAYIPVVKGSDFVNDIDYGGTHIYFKPKKNLEKLLREYNCKTRNNGIPCDDNDPYLEL